MRDIDMKDERRILHFIDAIYLNGFLWTSALEWNGYYRIDIKTGEAECLGVFANASVFADKLFYQILAYQEFVFFIPWFSNYLVKLDTGTLDIMYWELPASVAVESAKFRAAYLYKSKIYMFPMFGVDICIFDIEEGSFSCDDEWRKGNKLKCLYSDFLPGYQMEDKIYLPTTFNNSIFVYKLESYDHEFVMFPDSEKAIIDIINYKKNEFLVLSWKGNVWKYNSKSGEKELIYVYDGEIEQPYWEIERNNDNIYLIPANETNIINIKERKNLNYPADWKLDYLDVGVKRTFGEHFEINNYLYLPPIRGNMLLKLDVNKDKICGIEIFDDSNRYKKVIDKYEEDQYAMREVLHENRMNINILINVLKHSNKSKKKLSDKGIGIWRTMRGES